MDSAHALEEAELVRARAKQASMLLTASPKPGAGTVPSSGNTSKDSGIGSQYSGSREFTPPGLLGSGAPVFSIETAP